MPRLDNPHGGGRRRREPVKDLTPEGQEERLISGPQGADDVAGNRCLDQLVEEKPERIVENTDHGARGIPQSPTESHRRVLSEESPDLEGLPATEALSTAVHQFRVCLGGAAATEPYEEIAARNQKITFHDEFLLNQY